MNVIQITKHTAPSTLLPWWDRALNDPKVRPFLSGGRWREAPSVEDHDHGSARFMTADNNGLMSVTFDHMRRECSVGLWTLGGDPRTAAVLMRHLVRQVMPRYAMEWATFKIAGDNEPWISAMTERFADHCWGREPGAMWSERYEMYVDAHHFRVPRSAMLR